ncbi:MAG: hypothetical protein ABSH19_10090, partial [Opitutales bacterium]
MPTVHDGSFVWAGGVVGRGAALTFAGDVVDGVLAGFGAVVVVLRVRTVGTAAGVVGTAPGDDENVGTGCACASAADSVIGPLADFLNTAQVAVMAPPQMTRIASVTTIRFVVISFVTAPSHSCCASDSKRRQIWLGAAITRSTVFEPNAPAQKVTGRDHHAPNVRPTFRQRPVAMTAAVRERVIRGGAWDLAGLCSSTPSQDLTGNPHETPRIPQRPAST